jgi:outer membrane protein
MSKVGGALLALSLIGATSARADDVALSVRQVVMTAKQHNPQLKAALLELESANWDVFGNEALYEPVLLIDSSASQAANPNVFGASVRINRSRRLDLGAELKKHLLWGTDLSLRLSGSTQWSRLSGSIGTLPTGVGTGGQMTGVGTGMTTVLPGFGNFGPIYGMNAKLSLKQPLWRGRGRDVGEASLRESKAQRTASEYARDRVSSELLRDVLTAYWELWYADAAVAIQLQSQAVSIKQRDDAIARAQSGSLAPSEVLTFETQVATRDEEVLAARTERDRRAHELARLLGDNEQASALGPVSDEPASDATFARDVLEQRALAQAPEIRERQAALQIAELRQKTADDPNKPRLDLDSYVQTQGLGNESVRDAADMFVGGDVVSAFVSLTYEAPVRDRARRAAAAQARIASQVAEEQLRQVRERVIADVRTALDRESAGRQKVALAEQTASIAARQLAAEQARYQSGSSTPLAVLEAEDKVRGAQLRLARARADLTESALLLEHLSGELLSRYAAL